ncbi:ATP synthase subunit ATP5MPL, mitochondrial [Engraulis encrasicolus]|uniref:ATP synthase subunit ATP5MPL, mitochondrial n=1 Tax=Engraulis encrasicolus TaxID=184585 RepID=UPI002FD0B0C3
MLLDTLIIFSTGLIKSTLLSSALWCRRWRLSLGGDEYINILHISCHPLFFFYPPYLLSHKPLQGSAEFVTSRQSIAQNNLKMSAFARWWGKVSPYYTKAYQEMWVGVGIMTYLYYKVSFAGKKPVEASAHPASAPSHAAASAAPKAAAAAAAAATAAAAVAAASPEVAGDVTMNDILQRQHKNLILEERKLNLEIEKLELEKAKLLFK